MYCSQQSKLVLYCVRNFWEQSAPIILGPPLIAGLISLRLGTDVVWDFLALLNKTWCRCLVLLRSQTKDEDASVQDAEKRSFWWLFCSVPIEKFETSLWPLSRCLPSQQSEGLWSACLDTHLWAGISKLEVLFAIKMKLEMLVKTVPCYARNWWRWTADWAFKFDGFYVRNSAMLKKRLKLKVKSDQLRSITFVFPALERAPRLAAHSHPGCCGASTSKEGPWRQQRRSWNHLHFQSHIVGLEGRRAIRQGLVNCVRIFDDIPELLFQKRLFRATFETCK